MIGVIEKTPLASLVPLGNGYFRGQGRYLNHQVRFVVRLTPNGRALICAVQITDLPATPVLKEVRYE